MGLEKTKIYSNKRGVEKLQKFISADCRADRLRKDMFSTDFANICAECMLDNKEYICLPFTLSDKKNLILNIVVAIKTILNMEQEQKN